MIHRFADMPRLSTLDLNDRVSARALWARGPRGLTDDHISSTWQPTAAALAAGAAPASNPAPCSCPRGGHLDTPCVTIEDQARLCSVHAALESLVCVRSFLPIEWTAAPPSDAAMRRNVVSQRRPGAPRPVLSTHGPCALHASPPWTLATGSLLGTMIAPTTVSSSGQWCPAAWRLVTLSPTAATVKRPRIVAGASQKVGLRNRVYVM